MTVSRLINPKSFVLDDQVNSKKPEALSTKMIRNLGLPFEKLKMIFQLHQEYVKSRGLSEKIKPEIIVLNDEESNARFESLPRATRQDNQGDLMCPKTPKAAIM